MCVRVRRVALCCVFLQIMRELANNGVEIYCFPVDDEAVADVNAKMNVSVDLVCMYDVCACVCVRVVCDGCEGAHSITFGMLPSGSRPVCSNWKSG